MKAVPSLETSTRTVAAEEETGGEHRSCAVVITVALVTPADPNLHTHELETSNPVPDTRTDVPPVVGPRVGSIEFTSKKKNDNPVEAKLTPFSAMLRPAAPDPKGSGHNTPLAVIATAVVMLSPNRHLTDGAGEGRSGILEPTTVIVAEEPEGPVRGDRAVNAGVEYARKLLADAEK